MEEVDTGEKIKRWRIPQRTLNSLISFSVEELTTLKTAMNCLKQSGLEKQANVIKQIELKLKNIIKPDIKRRIEVDAMDWHLYTWGNHVKVIKPENWHE